MYYIGLDVHKKTISYCVKHGGGEVHQQGVIHATRDALDDWSRRLPQPWTGAMEATMFTGWIYDHLLPHAASLKVAHPLMLRAIAAAKRKNDRVDAAKIADLLRVNLCRNVTWLRPPFASEDALGAISSAGAESVQMKNRMAGLLMETGVAYNKQKLHQKRYFAELVRESAELPPALKPLLNIGRETVDRAATTEKVFLRALQQDPSLKARVERLTSIPGIGPVRALSWSLEIGEVSRFPSLKHAVR